MKATSFIYCAGLAVTLAFTPPASRAEIRGDAGALFTMDNATAGNHVLAYSRAAEGVLIVEDVKNIGANYDPTLLAWEENFRRAWPRFADRYGERFRRMWRFYLLGCAGAIRARTLQVFSILFSKEATAIERPVRDHRQAASLSRTAVLERAQSSDF